MAIFLLGFFFFFPLLFLGFCLVLGLFKLGDVQ